MPRTLHCKHCWGNCRGTCLLPGGAGMCIHTVTPGPPVRDWPRLVGTRRFWRWFFFRR